MNCLFCCRDAAAPLTKEHVVSQPIAEAFGIDRDDSLAMLDGWTLADGDVHVSRMVQIRDLAVRLPCSNCNSGWMNDLEHEMASVARWTRALRNGLSRDADRALRRWLLKTYIIFTALEGGIRRFGSSDAFHMVPEASRARMLWENSDEAVSNVAFGFARSPGSGFSYSFGNPTVLPAGPQYANCRSAGAMVLKLGPVSCCAVVPLFSARVTLPPPFRDVRVGDTFHSLPKAAALFDVESIVVDNGEHDIREINERLLAWAIEIDAQATRVDLDR